MKFVSLGNPRFFAEFKNYQMLLCKAYKEGPKVLAFLRTTSIVAWILSLIDLFSLFLVARFVQVGFSVTTGLKERKVTQLPFDLDRFLWKDLQDEMIVIGIIFVVFFALKSFLSLYLNYKTIFFLSKHSVLLSKNLTKGIFLNFGKIIQEKNSHELVAGINSTNTFLIGYFGGIFLLVGDLASIITIFLGALIWKPAVGLVTMLSLFLIARVVYYYGSRKVFNLSQEVGVDEILHVNRLLDAIAIFKELILSGKLHIKLRELHQTRLKITRSRALLAFLPNLSRHILELGTFLVLLLVTMMQILLFDLEEALASSAIFLVAFIRFFPAMLRIQNHLLNIRQGIGASIHTRILIDSFLSEESHFQELETLQNTSSTLEPFVGSVRVKNVTFNYSGDQKATLFLKEMDLEIEEGEFVAIVGKSGSGKSTLLSLMMGFLMPSEGEILISNMNPRDAIRKWPGKVALVSQDLAIIQDTFENNISLTDSNTINKEWFATVLESSALSRFMNGHIDGAQGFAMERGKNLSGGEKQRIGIARALFSKPAILFLDEATSALDSETELDINSSINTKFQGVTRVVVAHRLSTVRKADKVIYLVEGRIQAIGRFDQILERFPDFAKQAELSGLS